MILTLPEIKPPRLLHQNMRPTFKGLPLGQQHLPVHQPGTIYRVALRAIETNDKEIQPTPEQITTLANEANRLKNNLSNTIWLSRVPYDGEMLLISGPLSAEITQLVPLLSKEASKEIYNQLREKRFLDILV